MDRTRLHPPITYSMRSKAHALISTQNRLIYKFLHISQVTTPQA